MYIYSIHSAGWEVTQCCQLIICTCEIRTAPLTIIIPSAWLIVRLRSTVDTGRSNDNNSNGHFIALQGAYTSLIFNLNFLLYMQRKQFSEENWWGNNFTITHHMWVFSKDVTNSLSTVVILWWICFYWRKVVFLSS